MRLPKRLFSIITVILLMTFEQSIAQNSVVSQAEELLDKLADLIEDNYVDVESGRQIARQLRTADQLPEVASARSPEALAAVLTELLKQHDGHFSVMWRPPSEKVSEEVLEQQQEKQQQEQMAAVKRQNYGFRELRVLAGNIGYLRMDQFSNASVPEAAQAAVGAMNFLASSDAVVIDLRQNGGGDPNMVQLISSYLFDQPTYLNALYYRPTDTTRQFWTHADVQGHRMADTPVYVLISARTGSAAEEFAYNLQSLERATLVGKTTYGGANPGGVFPIMDGYSAFISTGKAINPITQTNWEGVGVVPDIDIAPSEALQWAVNDALTNLTETAGSSAHSRELAWAIEAYKPVGSLSEAQTDQLIGQYSGDRRIQLTAGQLQYVRGRREPQNMLSLGDDRFMFKGMDGFRLTFQRGVDGEVTGLTENWVFGLVRPWPKQ